MIWIINLGMGASEVEADTGGNGVWHGTTWQPMTGVGCMALLMVIGAVVGR